jgi:peptidoglycan hydrolase-like protein with peptidoglycan-binding domain
VNAVRARSLTVIALAAVLAVSVAPARANPQQAGIQVALRALGLYCGPIDGVVGPATVAAIKAAQKREHLPVTGIADVRTRAALGPLGRPLFGERALARRDFGFDVAVLQFILLRDGVYKGALDGYLGAETEAAVRSYQRRMGLAADGVAGPSTVAALVRQTGVPVRPRPAAPAAPKPIYVVQPGDTLTAIADHYGLSLTTLAKANRFDPANVLLIGKRLTIPAPALEATPAGIPARLDMWSTRLGVSPRLVRALAWMESGYQPRVVSSAGARGILQTLPVTRQFVEEVLVGHPLPRTLDGDIEVGVLYLRHLLRRFDGDKRLALAAWYQGEAAVRAHGLFKVTEPFVADVLALESRM